MLRLRPPRARLAPLAGIFCILRSRHAAAELPLRKHSERGRGAGEGAGGGEFAQFLLSVWAAHWIGAWRGARGWINARELFALRMLAAARSARGRAGRGRWAGLVTTSAQIVADAGVACYDGPVPPSKTYPQVTPARTASCASSPAASSPVFGLAARHREVLFLSAWRFYKPRMASEDKILEEQFGDAWRNYAAKTPSRLLPFVVTRAPP